MFSLKEVAVLFAEIYFSVYEDKKGLLYMTNYHISPDVQEALLVKYQDCIKVLKPHPQMGIDEAFFKLFDFVIENFILAEILIARLLVNCSSLTMLYEGVFCFRIF